MANFTIPDLTPAGTLDGTEEIEVAGAKKTTSKAIADLGGLGYLVYTFMISQATTDEPVVIVMKNTLGFDIYWQRDDIGTYVTRASAGVPLPAGSFPTGKTWTNISQVTSFIADPNGVAIQWDAEEQIEIQSGWAGQRADSVLFRNCVEIRVYP